MHSAAASSRHFRRAGRLKPSPCTASAGRATKSLAASVTKMTVESGQLLLPSLRRPRCCAPSPCWRSLSARHRWPAGGCPQAPRSGVERCGAMAASSSRELPPLTLRRPERPAASAGSHQAFVVAKRRVPLRSIRGRVLEHRRFSTVKPFSSGCHPIQVFFWVIRRWPLASSQRRS
jgi:hypothetical protein